MMRARHVLAALVAVFALASASFATVSFNVSLDGSQEVPPNGSPAFGTATVLLDTVGNTMTVDLSFAGLLAPQTAAHLHGPALQGQNAGVLVGFPVGQLVGAVFPITDVIEGHMLAGLTYINVHTQQFPGGEIRGQLVQPVSVESSSWGGIKSLYR
jgi:hypothetical protein